MKVSRVPYSSGPSELLLRASEPEGQALLVQLRSMARVCAAGPYEGLALGSPVAKIIAELERIYP